MVADDVKDVSSAVEKLISEVIAPAMKPEVHQDSNAFRRKQLYFYEVDDVLREHLPSLKSLFEGYANSR